jgi:hypothetical protein
VTAAGQLLCEFEALIHASFGSVVSECTGSGDCHSGWLYRGTPQPLSEYSPYTFAFSSFRASTLHLAPARLKLPAGAFGNYPAPVTVNGQYVACNASATLFLISYGDAVGSGLLGCLARLPQ